MSERYISSSVGRLTRSVAMGEDREKDPKMRIDIMEIRLNAKTVGKSAALRRLNMPLLSPFRFSLRKNPPAPITPAVARTDSQRDVSYIA